MSELHFYERGWEDYLSWQARDKQTLLRINRLLQEIQRDSFSGLGKPEPLKHGLSGWWSRRIDEENRIVYRVRDGVIEIASCRSHYAD